MKEITRITILVPLAIYLIYCSFHFITTEWNPVFLDCGEIVSKYSDEVDMKNGVRTILYLNVDLKKSGFKSIKCEPTAYFSKEIGDNVCFHLQQKKTIHYQLSNMIGCVVIIISGFILLIILIRYLVPDSWDSWDL